MTNTRTALIRIYIANLAAYNAGYLCGEWLALPATDEEIAETLECIGCGEHGAEYAIHDYESNYGLKADEYDNIFDLNEQIRDIDELGEEEFNMFAAYMEAVSDDITEALNALDRCTLYENCDSLEDLAAEFVNEGCFGEIPDSIINYIDYEAIARDLSYEGYSETTYGVLYHG